MIEKTLLKKLLRVVLVCHTSIKETSTAAIIPKAWSALNVGAPHCNGYGMLILTEVQGKVTRGM